MPDNDKTPAELAGWNPDDGDPPFDHTAPVEPIAEADTAEGLPQ